MADQSFEQILNNNEELAQFLFYVRNKLSEDFNIGELKSVATNVQSNSATWQTGVPGGAVEPAQIIPTFTNYLSSASNRTLIAQLSTTQLTATNVFSNRTHTTQLTANQLSAIDVFANTVNTVKPQTIYEGRIAPYFFLTTNEIKDYNRLGRFTMIKVRNTDNNKIRLVETSTNKFQQGDVVGVWFQNSYSNTTTQLYLPVEYVPFGGAAVPIGTIKGGWGYDEAAAYFKFTGSTFLSGNPVNNTEINTSGIASELRVEYVEPKDPGEPFSVVGRASLVHGLTMKAGDQKFTNGSDHFHLIHAGGNGDPLLFWQYLNGGYQHTTQRLAIHTLAQRGPESQFRIVAANSLSLSANQLIRPYGVAIPGTHYLAAWISDYNGTSLFNVGNWVYMSVSPAGTPSTSLRGIGFTAASYPCKIVSNNAIGSAASNADIPAGQTLPANANRHLRLEPVNLTVDNWVNNPGSGAFSNTLTNTGEVFRAPARTMISPVDQQVSLSALAGYDTIQVRNGCEVVFNFTTTPLVSSRLQFLYEGASVLLFTSTNNTLSANNYDGLNYAKSSHGLQLDLNPASPNYGNFTGVKGTYDQQTFDGYIYRATPNQVVVRVGLLPGLGECRLQKIPHVDPRWYSGVLPGYNQLVYAAPPNNDAQINGERITSNPAGINMFGAPGSGLWGNAYTGSGYTMPNPMKTGIEFLDIPATSYTEKQVYVYFGNKDPVHRPIASHQTWHFERYPTINPDFKQTGGIVSKFGIGPSCEGMDIDTASIGFGSTAYHRRSMAIGHKVETLSAEEIAIGVDNSVFRVGLSGLAISPAMLSSNGVDTFLKIKSDNGQQYGLKLQLI